MSTAISPALGQRWYEPGTRSFMSVDPILTQDPGAIIDAPELRLSYAPIVQRFPNITQARYLYGHALLGLGKAEQAAAEQAPGADEGEQTGSLEVDGIPGLVLQDPDSHRYYLGPMVFELGLTAAPRFNLRRGAFAFKGDYDYVKAAIDRLSGESRVMFTERELWYEFNRKWMKPGFWRSPYGCLPVLGLLPAVLAATNVLGFGMFLVGIFTGAVGLVAGILLSSRANRLSPRPPRPPRAARPP